MPAFKSSRASFGTSGSSPHTARRSRHTGLGRQAIVLGWKAFGVAALMLVGCGPSGDLRVAHDPLNTDPADAGYPIDCLGGETGADLVPCDAGTEPEPPLACGDGEHFCGSDCFGDDDVDHCGASLDEGAICLVCPGSPFGEPTCAAGACGLSCRAPAAPCAEGCCHPGPTLEIVDSQPFSGAHASIALGPDGLPCIGYQTRGYYDAKIACRDGAGWHIQDVYDEGQVGDHTTLAIDATGVLHLAFRDVSARKLRYARLQPNGAGYEILREIIDEDDIPGYEATLDLTSTGNPVVVYRTFSGDVRIARRDATSSGPSTWSRFTVEVPAVRAYDLAFAIDGTDTNRILVSDLDGRRLLLVSGGSAGWTTEVIADNGALRFPSIAIGEDNRVHMAYADVEAGDLRYAVARDGGGYAYEVAASDGTVGLHASIALSPTGVVGIAYLDSTRAALGVATRIGGHWTQQIVDGLEPGRTVGGYASLTYDTVGNPHVAYMDSSASALRYGAYFDVPATSH